MRTAHDSGWWVMRVWRDYGALGAGTFALEAPEVRVYRGCRVCRVCRVVQGR
jgi:hypothetical protein